MCTFLVWYKQKSRNIKLFSFKLIWVNLCSIFACGWLSSSAVGVMLLWPVHSYHCCEASYTEISSHLVKSVRVVNLVCGSNVSSCSRHAVCVSSH